MKKVFVTAISLQGRGGLEKTLYHPVDFTLTENILTSFPIIPIINREKEEFDIRDIEIIAIRSENEDTKDNFHIFLEEVKGLGIEEGQVKELKIPEKQDKQTSLRMLLNLLDLISDDSLVYADITFNTKPISAMILYAMQLIEKMKDTEVNGIYYGEITRNKGVAIENGAKLYDLTIFKDLHGFVSQMEILGIQDIRSSIKKIIDL